jgi:hypothetical protein
VRLLRALLAGPLVKGVAWDQAAALLKGALKAGALATFSAAASAPLLYWANHSETKAYQRLGDVCLAGVAACHHAPIGVDVHGLAPGWPGSSQQLVERIGSHLAAAVVLAGRILARLPALGRIHAPQPDALVLDLDGVAVDDRSAASDRLGRAYRKA